MWNELKENSEILPPSDQHAEFVPARGRERHRDATESPEAENRVTYSYAGGNGCLKGYLCSVGSSVSSSGYQQNQLGQVTSSSQQTQGHTYAFTYTVDLQGNLKSVLYPSTRLVNYTLSSAGRATTVAATAPTNTTYASGIVYAPNGAVSGLTMGNNIVETIAFDNKFQATSITGGKSGSNPLLALGYGYALNGNMHCAAIAGGSMSLQSGNPCLVTGSGWSASQSYGYDGVNRLVTATEGSNWGQQYAYDIYGNHWVDTTSGNTYQIQLSLLTPTGNSTSSSAYDPTTNRLYPGTNNANYDAAGNQIGLLSGFVITYDGENRVSTVTLATGAQETYSYDGEGRRVEHKELVNGSATKDTIYVYDALGHLAAEYGTATATPPCVTCYLTADSLGSTRLMTDTNGNPMARYDYLPFGEEVPSSIGGRSGPNAPQCNGASCYTQTTAVTEKFTAKEHDAETGLDYFGFRYFSSPQARWTSPDQPFADQHADDPQSWNMYGYVRNNPLTNTDPNGKDCTNGLMACGNFFLGALGVVANIPSSVANLPNRVIDALISPFTNFRFGDVVQPAFTPSNIDQQQGMEAANASIMVSPLAELGAAEAPAAASELPLILRNAAQGRAWQNQVAADTALTDTDVVQNVTVRTQSGLRTQIDVVSTNSAGNVVLQEAKSSATARVRPNQTAAHTEIEQSGGTVAGEGKPGYPGGTQISPTRVQIVRPRCPGDPGCSE